MSVIIEGLTLPKHNPKEIDKNVLIGYAIVKEDNTAELCLEGVRYLIKMLPTPHGRLIDADELFCKIDGIKGWDYGDESDMAISAAEALSAIDDSPTVIEAEANK